MVDPDALSVGDPSIITAKLVGMGNFGRISAPELDTGGNWKITSPKLLLPTRATDRDT